jgi:nicotinate-nucleotide adenylyltransferase
LKPPVALLGGTFDPVHYGHLRFADAIRRTLGLDAVRLVPASDPPHRAGPQASAADRVAMLKLAVAEFPGLVVDEREIARAGKSYTVLTLEELRREDPQRPVLLLLGADAFLGLPTWHRWRELFGLAHLVVVPRPGVTLADGLPPALVSEWDARVTTDPAILFSTPAGAIYEASVPPQPIAATAIRTQLAAGAAGRDKVAQLIPRAVLAYIDQHGLYSTLPDAT